MDVLVITEAKFNDTFSASQFFMNELFVPYRLDRDRNRGEIMIYTSDNISSRLLAKHVFPDVIEALLIDYIRW